MISRDQLIAEETPILRSVPMPADTVLNRYISAGWLLSIMDLAGGMRSYELTKGRTVTVSLDSMSFHHPVYVGDDISCFGKLVRLGTTSMTLKIEAHAIRRETQEHLMVTEGYFSFVHLDERAKSKPLDRPYLEAFLCQNEAYEGQKRVLHNASLTKKKILELLQKDKELSLRSYPLPKDTNYFGDIFGGWILAEMDKACLKEAARIAKSKVVTVGIEGMSFVKPIKVGDDVIFLTNCERIGRTSITMKVQAYVYRDEHDIFETVTEGLFTYVAVDKRYKTVQIGHRLEQ